MVRPSLVALPLALALLLLAGCTGPAAPTPNEERPDPILHTRPGMADATTDPTRFHLHDYWLGQTHLVILEETQPATVTAMGVEVNRLQFRPPAGNVIPLGTGNVSVTMTWSADAASLYGPVHLYVKTQADNVSQDLGIIENGVPFIVPSTNAQNDLPHQLLSAWSFDFYLTPDPATQILRFAGEVTTEVIAERSLPIPLFPPHRDPWGNATTIELFEDEASVGQIDHAPAPNRICTGGCINVHVPQDGRFIPAGTATVEVTVTLGEGALGDFLLAYHGPDARGFTEVEPTRTDGATRTYSIPVAPEMVDGPYAASSLWEFQLSTVKTADNGWFGGDYTIKATAQRAT